MKKIICKKYHNFGNSFIVLDETRQTLVDESLKGEYSANILNADTGIGADGLIVLSNPYDFRQTPLPTGEKVDYVFRHFEPDGSESFMCLNGALVSVMFAFQVLNKKRVRLLAATNTQRPWLLNAGIVEKDETGRVFIQGKMMSAVDNDLVHPDIRIPFLPGVDKISHFDIRFRENDTQDLGMKHSRLSLSGFLVSSGEPHLVILTDQIDDCGHLADLLFNLSLNERRSALGDELIHDIGMRVQHEFCHYFPQGLNLTFVHVLETSDNSEPSGPLIRYRCFERAINKETLSCGTAALACAGVLRSIGCCRKSSISIYPYLFNLNHPSAFYTVYPETPVPDQWRIVGQPELISDHICFNL
ncbi:MAG: hypothetical protein GY797_21565 [Deltaproteobacteria bacterium]|nr:hypothetical protein [Deltaproteobacteria bacterium]